MIVTQPVSFSQKFEAEFAANGKYLDYGLLSPDYDLMLAIVGQPVKVEYLRAICVEIALGVRAPEQPASGEPLPDDFRLGLWRVAAAFLRFLA